MLVNALKEENVENRIAAAYALWNLDRSQSKVVLPVLTNALSEGIGAITILGLFDETSNDVVLLLLNTAFKDINSSIRSSALEALIKIGRFHLQVLLPELEKALKDEEEEVRRTSAKLLSTFCYLDPSAIVPLLSDVLADKAWNVVYDANEALKKCDLSSFIKSCPNILKPCGNLEVPLTSTPLHALVSCYQNDRSSHSVYPAAIAMKCIEENISIFQEKNAVFFIEKGRQYKINISKNLEEIQECYHQYPQFDLPVPESNSCIIS